MSIYFSKSPKKITPQVGAELRTRIIQFDSARQERVRLNRSK